MMRFSHLVLLFFILCAFSGRVEKLQNKFGVRPLDGDVGKMKGTSQPLVGSHAEKLFNGLPKELHADLDKSAKHHVDLQEFKRIIHEESDRRRLHVCDDICQGSTRYNGRSPGWFWTNFNWNNAEISAYRDLKPKYELFFGTSFSSWSYMFHYWALLYKWSGMDITDKKAVSIMWAHMSQEAGPSLQYIKESGCPTEHPKCCNYGSVSGSGACTQNSDGNKKYFGRGAFQLSHEQNYADFGCAMCTSIKENPWFVEFSMFPMASAIYYFKLNTMDRCSSIENAVVCFLRSVYKINGVQECKTSSTSDESDAGINRAEVTNRVKKFKKAYKAVYGFELWIPSLDCDGLSPSFKNGDSFNCDFCDSGSTDFAGDCEDDHPRYSPWMYTADSCPAYN